MVSWVVAYVECSKSVSLFQLNAYVGSRQLGSSLGFGTETWSLGSLVLFIYLFILSLALFFVSITLLVCLSSCVSLCLSLWDCVAPLQSHSDAENRPPETWGTQENRISVSGISHFKHLVIARRESCRHLIILSSPVNNTSVANAVIFSQTSIALFCSFWFHITAATSKCLVMISERTCNIIN